MRLPYRHDSEAVQGVHGGDARALVPWGAIPGTALLAGGLLGVLIFRILASSRHG